MTCGLIVRSRQRTRRQGTLQRLRSVLEWPEMAPDRRAEVLTANQLAVGEALAQGMGIIEAARLGHMSPRTVIRLKQRPEFDAYLQELRSTARERCIMLYADAAERLVRNHIAIAHGRRPSHEYQVGAINTAIDRVLGPTKGAFGRMGFEHTKPDGSTYRVVVDYRDGQAPRWLSQESESEPTYALPNPPSVCRETLKV